jgi:hypothetical protein
VLEMFALLIGIAITAYSMDRRWRNFTLIEIHSPLIFFLFLQKLIW